MSVHDTNTTTGTTGTTTSSSAPRVTTAGTGAGRSLDYSLDFRTLDRLKQANLATAKGELQKLGQVTQLGKMATTGIALTSQAMQQGAAITQEKIGLWKDFSDRESWASPEYYEAFMAEEDKFREEYELAVKRGETQKADRLLADQTKRSSNLQGFVKNAESAKQMYDQGLYLKYDPALGEKNIISEADDFYLTKFIENKDTVPVNVDGKSMIGVDYSDQFGITPPQPVDYDNDGIIDGIPASETAKARDAAKKFITDGKLDPKKVAEHLNITEQEAKSYVYKDGRILRAHTPSEVDSLINKATKPEALSSAVLDSFKAMEVQAGKDPKKYTTNFNDNDISTKFGNFIVDADMARKAAVSEIAGRTFIDDFTDEANPVWNDIKLTNITGGIKVIDGSTPQALATAAGDDGILDASEMSGLDRKLVVEEMMKPHNIEIFKQYWGEWCMLRAKTRVKNVDTEDEKTTTIIDTEIPVTSGNLQGNSAN